MTDHKPRPRQLTRREIRDGLAHTPMDALLLGQGAKHNGLTAKQRRFAEAVAMGETQTQAYRIAYNTTTTNKDTQAHTAHTIASNPKVSALIHALELAQEARAYATPAALRQLVIDRLTAHAIDEGIPPAQRLRALELLGKVTEVAAFTERREVIKVTDSGSARDNLLAMLRLAIRGSAVDAVLANPGDALMRELSPVDMDMAPPGDDSAPGDSAPPHPPAGGLVPCPPLA